jgi:hypothetical protein
MRWFSDLLDNLDQSPGAQIKTRRSILGGLGFIAAAASLSDVASGKKRRKKRGKKRCKRRKRCGKGCCKPDSCFASSVDTVTTKPLDFACCPADKLCRSTKPPYPDQCCYPDETCQPSLTDNPEAETICCRPCAGGVGGCCLKLNEECRDGKCELVDTARLARTRRPG